MRLIAAVLCLLMLMSGFAIAESEIEKIYPDTPVNAATPLQVWKVTLDTDSGGNASYVTGLLVGRVYSIDVMNLSLTNSTNLTVKEYSPNETTLFSGDVYADGNSTTFPRVGSYEYMIKGLVRLAIVGGDPNKEVPVYLNIER